MMLRYDQKDGFIPASPGDEAALLQDGDFDQLLMQLGYREYGGWGDDFDTEVRAYRLWVDGRETDEFVVWADPQNGLGAIIFVTGPHNLFALTLALAVLHRGKISEMLEEMNQRDRRRFYLEHGAEFGHEGDEFCAECDPVATDKQCRFTAEMKKKEKERAEKLAAVPKTDAP